MIEQAPKVNYDPSLKVLDIRSYNTSETGVYTIGGFIGELILTFAAMQKTIR